MNGVAASTRRRPTGCSRRAAICSSASSTVARIVRAYSRNAAPSSVSSSRRVVRRSSVVCSLSSSRARVRLVAEMVSSSSSAAAVIEPLSTTATKAFSSSRVVFIFYLGAKAFPAYTA